MGFQTTHEVVVDDARSLSLPDDSVELVVTSPPYPMIEMWDDVFAGMDPAVEDALAAGDGQRAFEAMHALLDDVWAELARVLAPGGVACINVGDATRTVEEFQVYPNHARVLRALRAQGLRPLPDILWRKPANSAAKFMGSGMLPPNAYATLEHEYVLVVRNGGPREFDDSGRERRYESAYFWEERNEWFSDVWTDVRGIAQELDPDDVDGADEDLRDRSGAFPLALPYRLINMYSVYGDTVLDPFLGTGTTSLAAAVAGRESVGYELDERLAAAARQRLPEAPRLSEAIADQRLRDHREFVAARRAEGKPPKYDSRQYDFGVTTKQERDLVLYAVDDVRADDGTHVATHRPVEAAPPER